MRQDAGTVVEVRSICPVAGVHSWFEDGNGESCTCIHCERVCLESDGQS